jgi:hypothetical protein
MLIAGCAGYESKGMFSFKRSLNNRPYGFKKVSAPHPVRVGKTSERFEVKPGDCYWNTGWNDCKNDRERSELSEQEPYSSIGREYWYGWSIFIPKSYPNIYPTKTALGQFHQKQVGRPPVMFQNHNGGYWLDLNQMNGRSSGYYLLIPEGKLRGRWHDIIVHAKWSKDESGFIRVWVNGVLKVKHSGPLTKYSHPIYFKYGIYRSFLSRYKNANNIDKVPIQVVYFDEVRKGRSREDVVLTLRK